MNLNSHSIDFFGGRGGGGCVKTLLTFYFIIMSAREIGLQIRSYLGFFQKRRKICTWIGPKSRWAQIIQMYSYSKAQMFVIQAAKLV